jgi:hypothetical protein
MQPFTLTAEQLKYLLSSLVSTGTAPQGVSNILVAVTRTGTNAGGATVYFEFFPQ